jgi:hypothetical protein
MTAFLLVFHWFWQGKNKPGKAGKRYTKEVKKKKDFPSRTII